MIEEFKTYLDNNDVALIVQILIGIIIAVLLAMLAIFHKFIWNKVRKIPRAFLDRLVDRIREEVVESFIRHNLPEISYILRQDLEEELSKLQPPPLPQGISGTPCPKSGLYYSQQFPKEQQVYEKDEIFTEAQDSKGRYVKTYWVLEEPVSHPRWPRQW